MLEQCFMILGTACVVAGTAHAAESASFRFEDDPLNTTQTAEGTSDSYRWRESAVSWQSFTNDQLRESGDATQESPADTGNTPATPTRNEGGGRRAESGSATPKEALQTISPAENEEKLPDPPRALESPPPADSLSPFVADAENRQVPTGVPTDRARVPDGRDTLVSLPPVSANPSLTPLPEALSLAEPSGMSLTAQLLDAAMPASLTTGTAAMIVGLIGIGSFAFFSLKRRKVMRQRRLLRAVHVRSGKKLPRRHCQKDAHAWRITFLFILLLGSILPPTAAAESSVPQRLHYGGRLYDAAGTPVTAPHTMRFSFWTSADALGSDTTASGAILVSAPAFAGWQEVQTVTPDVTGQVSVELGSVTALPDMGSLPAEDLLRLSLQVEVKAAGTNDTAYELLDPDSADSAEDRFSLLSVPFALNAGMLDRRMVGTGSGAILLLGSGGLLSLQHMAAGTNQTAFALNAQNAATDAVLTFGNSILAETLKFSALNHRFEFSDSVHIEQNLTASGTLTVQGDARFNASMILNTVSYLFPASDGTASGKVLKTSGSGQLSWSDDAAAPDTAAFTDGTTESLTDAALDLWDGTYPNITPSSAAHTLLLSVMINGTANANDDEVDAFSIHRAIGENPTCNHPIVGGVFSGTFTTKTGDAWSAGATFLDAPETTVHTRYTVCSHTAATGTVSNDTGGIWFSLIELGP